ncbi:MAG: hypothetical protein QOH96_858 [Blastocatellia bacterium]|jgi:hypothetical protein|nr:hypothetical protein [Blastocatellia bacterium]
MKNCKAPENQTQCRILLIACATALAVGFMVSLPEPAYAQKVTPPPVPANIQVPPGNKAFLEGHGVGTQNYICLPSVTSVSGFAFVLFTPQATLFKDNDRQVITHFNSPNPVEGGTIRVTWQHSRDTSRVWGEVLPGNSSSDPNFVAPGAIPWLLVTIVGAQDGPTGGDTLTDTTFIQRLNTSGGVAPSTGCASLADVGHQAYVPYTADYFFFEKIGPGDKSMVNGK